MSPLEDVKCHFTIQVFVTSWCHHSARRYTDKVKLLHFDSGFMSFSHPPPHP